MKLSVRFADTCFAIIALAGLVMIYKEDSSAKLVIDAWEPWIQTIAAVILTSIMAAWAVYGTKLDRRCAEDYVFQLMSNAAVIAVVTSILSHAIWDLSILNRMGLPKPTSGDLLGVMLLSWGMGYTFYRVRGINP